MKRLFSNELFHIHTYRCGHAEMIGDEAYIKKALELGKTGIWFTDHAPFPGDPFGHRMAYAGLEEYLRTLSELKEKYAGTIDVRIGLEIEYFPSFDRQGYYSQLKDDPRIDMLLLGQHMAEDEYGTYTFSWDARKKNREEYAALGEAIVRGIKSGYFGIVAHPDRIFRRKKTWDEGMQRTAEEIIQTAYVRIVPLEINLVSLGTKRQFWLEFWNLAPADMPYVLGLDAHSIEDVDPGKSSESMGVSV